MKYIVSFSDERSWSRVFDEEKEAMDYAKQFRLVEGNSKVYKCVEIAHFNQKKQVKL